MRARFFTFERDMRFPIGLSVAIPLFSRVKFAATSCGMVKSPLFPPPDDSTDLSPSPSAAAVTVIRHHLLSRDIQRDLRVLASGAILTVFVSLLPLSSMLRLYEHPKPCP